LETNPSTGKSWTFIVFGSSMLELVNVGYEAFPGPPAPGRPLIAKYVYKALKTGTTQLKMTYTGGETSIYDKTLTFNITVK
jgi:predicted secreted protein